MSKLSDLSAFLSANRSSLPSSIVVLLDGYLKELSFIEDFPLCEVPYCSCLADYEGWYRVRDFSGNFTGLIQRRNVCEDHKMLLIGFSEVSG